MSFVEFQFEPGLNLCVKPNHVYKPVVSKTEWILSVTDDCTF